MHNATLVLLHPKIISYECQALCIIDLRIEVAMKYAKKIVCCIAIINSFALPYANNKTNKNYIQRRNQKTKERREGTPQERVQRTDKPWLRDNPPARRRVTCTLAEVASDA